MEVLHLYHWISGPDAHQIVCRFCFGRLPSDERTTKGGSMVAEFQRLNAGSSTDRGWVELIIVFWFSSPQNKMITQRTDPSKRNGRLKHEQLILEFPTLPEWV